MKKRKILSLLLVLAMCLSLVPASVFAIDTSVDFVVLSTTDMHGKVWDANLLTGDPVNNSLLSVSSAVYEIREEYGAENVVLIDNGDLYQGTPVSSYHIAQTTAGSVYSPNPMALALKYMDYDASVLGNHEFNYNWNTMSGIYDYLEDPNTVAGSVYGSVPVLAANLYWDGTDGVHTAGTNAFTPFITKDINVGGQSFKIGILGLENTDCTRWDVPENYPGITFEYDSTAEVEKYVPQMQAAGCDFIILVLYI